MSTHDSRQTLCLTMIVRNEAPVIRRCLASVLPLIDYWVIVDTGSTDGTQDIVRECLANVPGELIERPWVDFGHNRTEALGYARGHGGYVLMIDADEVLEVFDGFHKSDLTADAYLVDVQYGGKAYVRKQLLRNSLPWRYVGVLHEYADCDESQTAGFATGLRIVVSHDGARARDTQTYRRDAILLETALLDEPDNARYVFYLAQSYRDAGDFELAARNYQRRVEMAGWSEEVWFSLYQIACLHECMNYTWGVVMEDYLTAFQFSPNRAEPLFRIGLHYQRTGESHLARLFFSRATQLPSPSREYLFIEKDVYNYQLPLEHAASCSDANVHDEAITICNQLLRSGSLPPEHTERVLEIRNSSVQRRFQPLYVAGKPARIKICIPFRDPGPEFDDCVESLLLQNADSFDVVFIDDGSQFNDADRIPLGRPGFKLLRHSTPIGFAACLDQFVSKQCGPDDVVIPLGYTDRFADPDAVRRIGKTFEDEQCRLLYGQHRLPCGKLGDAEPAASEADFLKRRTTLASRSLFAFRARLWNEHQSQAYKDLQPHDESHCWNGLFDSSVFDAPMQAAGFQGTRFSDHVFTIIGDLAIPPRPDGITTAQEPGTAFWGEGRKPTSKENIPGELPMVSCLMVTNNRLALAKRAIRCYAAQTYPNRELVIVTDGEPRIRRGLERFIAELKLEDVRFIYLERANLTLGQLRNAAIDAAAGEVLCQWDDDDCYHPDRIRVQVEQMLNNNGRACCLTDHLQFLDEDRALVWIDWTLGGKYGKDQLLPGTIVMFKDDRFRYPESGPYARRGEDTVLLYDICETVPVVAAKGLGYLYLYTYHGRNSFDRDHHYRMSMFSRSISELQGEREVIRSAMAHYPVAKPYVAIGCDGPAFVLND